MRETHDQFNQFRECVKIISLFTETFYLFRPPERILQVSRFPLESLCISSPVMYLTSFRAYLAHEVHLPVRDRGAAQLSECNRRRRDSRRKKERQREKARPCFWKQRTFEAATGA